jgi:PAS domain S-box-containing protein
MKTKILILEHDVCDVELIQRELKKSDINYDYKIVNNEFTYTDALKSFSPDIILSDYSLPSFDGKTAFEIKQQLASTIPFIFVTGAIGEENSVELIKKGVTDVTLKDKLFILNTKIEKALKESNDLRIKKKTEQDLIESERRLAKAQQIAHIGSWDLDFTTNTVHFSVEACKIYGLTQETNRQTFDGWISFIHPEDLELVLKKVKESRDSLHDVSFNHRIIQANGTIRYVCSESRFEFDSNHKPISLYGIVQDVTKTKLIEDQIEFDKNNLNALINNTKDLMWSVDEDFKLITSNQPFDEITRLMCGKVLEKGSNILEAAFSQEQVNRYQTYYQRALAGETFTEIEYSRTPMEYWLETSFCPIQKLDKVVGVACHSRDITQRKKDEEKQKHNEAVLKEAQAIAHLGNWELNFDTGLSMLSEEACRIYGLPLEENMQAKSNWLAFVHPEDLEYVTKVNKESKKTLTDVNLNHRIILKNGAIKHIASKSRFVLDKFGKAVGSYGTCHDVTEIKETELHLRKSEAFNRSVLNSLSSHIAVINSSGKIITVNSAWKRFVSENSNALLQCDETESNYYTVCENAAKNGDKVSIQALKGMKDVMSGKKEVFYLEYPCHSLDKKRWFTMRVMKFESDEPMIVVAHMDITELKLAQIERDSTLSELESRVEVRTKELLCKNKNILDSINYAKRIQTGLLCRPTQLAEIFPKSFILSMPRDIVSGDFFWCYQKRSKKFIVVADCTGHGVPAALLSIIGNNLLTNIIENEHIENPSEILEILDFRLAEALKGDTQEVKDGMDLSLCVIDTYFNEIYFAGAHNSLFVSNESGIIHELHAARHSVGGGAQEINKKFETKRFPIIHGQRIYLSSDGYISQFGGPKGKKFMKSQFIKTLENGQIQSMDQQKNMFQNVLVDWMGNNEQVDDIMVVGIEL